MWLHFSDPSQTRLCNSARRCTERKQRSWVLHVFVKCICCLTVMSTASTSSCGVQVGSSCYAYCLLLKKISHVLLASCVISSLLRVAWLVRFRCVLFCFARQGVKAVQYVVDELSKRWKVTAFASLVRGAGVPSESYRRFWSRWKFNFFRSENLSFQQCAFFSTFASREYRNLALSPKKEFDLKS